MRLIPNIYARKLADDVTNRRSASSFLSQMRNDGSLLDEAKIMEIKCLKKNSKLILIYLIVVVYLNVV